MLKLRLLQEYLNSIEPPIKGCWRIEVDDFFNYSVESHFDFIYDYAFLCAIEPNLRQLWTEKMSKLLKPGGTLMTVIFPIGGEENKGPPFTLSLEEVKHLCVSEGKFECTGLYLLPPSMCHGGRNGIDCPSTGFGTFIRVVESLQ